MAHFTWVNSVAHPTIGSWIIALLYLSAAISCWRTARKLQSDHARTARERRAWQAISVVFLGLGISKQLDLDLTLTEAARTFAHFEGWYGQRQVMQIPFILLAVAVCIVAIFILSIWLREAPAPTWLSIVGAIFAIGFVLVRAASYHQMDDFIAKRILVFRWNWILEMLGFGVALIGSAWRQQMTIVTRSRQ